ncbi:MAG: M20/M25/M40 family metallo-hydrolase [Planctomycetota bacterium]
MESAALDLVQELMAIPGKSCQEREVVDFVRQRLLQAGLPESSILIDDSQTRSPYGGNTGSLIVKLAGRKRGPRRLLMAHLDTVPLCVGCQPVRDQDVIRSANPATALGADNRAGVAVLLHSLLEILRQDLPHPPVTFFWPIQEEIGLLGARHVKVADLGNPKLCFNWDGGSPQMACIGATGAYHIEISITGIASHAGVHPEQGASAIAIAGLAIADLQENGWHGLIKKGRKTGTSNIGVISGGDATNVVTSSVKLAAEVRSHDPEFRERLVKEFRKAFERAAKQVRTAAGQAGRVEFDAELKYESFKLDEAEPAVQEAQRAIRMIDLEPSVRISNGGLDANWLSSRGLPTVTLGCGQQDVHTVKETLHIPSFLAACRIGVILATAGV